MLNTSTRDNIHVIKMPVSDTYRVISVLDNHITKQTFIITGITEKEYNKIKSSKEIKIHRGEYDFEINPDDAICFGEIDFHEGSEDCETLDTFNWLERLIAKGICIPARYDYDKHICLSPIKSYLWTETFSISTLCRYYHGSLGKPQYTLIFREVQ